jgi:hypothetical protein
MSNANRAEMPPRPATPPERPTPASPPEIRPVPQPPEIRPTTPPETRPRPGGQIEERGLGTDLLNAGATTLHGGELAFGAGLGTLAVKKVVDVFGGGEKPKPKPKK